MVEYNLAKVGVAGSIPVSRSFYLMAGGLQFCRSPVSVSYTHLDVYKRQKVITGLDGNVLEVKKMSKNGDVKSIRQWL